MREFGKREMVNNKHITHFKMFQDKGFKTTSLPYFCTKPALIGQAHSIIILNQWLRV